MKWQLSDTITNSLRQFSNNFSYSTVRLVVQLTVICWTKVLCLLFEILIRHFNPSFEQHILLFNCRHFCRTFIKLTCLLMVLNRYLGGLFNFFSELAEFVRLDLIVISISLSLFVLCCRTCLTEDTNWKVNLKKKNTCLHL